MIVSFFSVDSSVALAERESSTNNGINTNSINSRTEVADVNAVEDELAEIVLN